VRTDSDGAYRFGFVPIGMASLTAVTHDFELLRTIELSIEGAPVLRQDIELAD
jgi:hypothetical protein